VALTNVPVAPLEPTRFEEVLSPEQAERLRRTIELARELLDGRVVWNLNSTARGGGVAELLQSLVGYARGAGIDARWAVIAGSPEFFTLTKRVHNRLHGSPGDGGALGEEEEAIYQDSLADNAHELAYLARPQDLFVLHDPQTAGLVAPLKERGASVVWRCHVGVDLAGDLAREAWRFLLPHLGAADRYVFSRENFVWEGLDRSRLTIIPPSIDAFSAKNQALSAGAVHAILRAAGIEDGPGDEAPAFVRRDGTPGRVDRKADLNGGSLLPAEAPVLVQISRWDRLKDHAGVLRSFVDEIAPRSDAHLILAGPSPAAVADDPEGLEVLREMLGAYGRLPDAMRDRVHLLSLPMEDSEENWAIVNALQRRADVIAQKSLAEGFGLTVAEAMWKATPVVAGRVGGICDQITDGVTGVLVDPRDLQAFGAAVVGLLEDPERAQRIGLSAREEVRELFLGPRHLIQYAELFATLLPAAEPSP
jgi:trehalose synthase